MRETRDAYRFLVCNLEATDHLEDLDGDGRLMLKWFFKKQMRKLIWIRMRTGVPL
jgi:hypothetical protein